MAAIHLSNDECASQVILRVMLRYIKMSVLNCHSWLCEIHALKTVNVSFKWRPKVKENR